MSVTSNAKYKIVENKTEMFELLNKLGVNTQNLENETSKIEEQKQTKKECQKRWNSRNKDKILAYSRKHNQTEKRKEYMKLYEQSKKRKAYKKEYWQRPEVKARQRELYKIKRQKLNNESKEQGNAKWSKKW